jgi:hypothetical protein
MFMAATAMATTVSTMAATAMVKAESTEPVAVTCACEVPTPTVAAPPAQAPSTEAPSTDAPSTEAPRDDAPDQLAASEPPAEQTRAEVVGALPKDMIRRIVKAHVNEVRYCYNEGLTKDPELAGRVVVQFVVGPEGGPPTKSAVESTDLEDGEVAECIASAVGRWQFPRPGNDEHVLITYPFDLDPG